MIFKDKVRFFLAIILKKRIILFSCKKEWEIGISKKLKNFVVFFYDFEQVNLSRFKTIIPLTLTSQKYLNDKKVYPLQALVPSNECMRLCNDKKLFNTFMLENDLGEFIPSQYIENSYPYILKERIGEWGLDCFIIKSSRDEEGHQEKIKSSDYFRQQLVSGVEEYTAHVIFKDGKIVFFKVLQFSYTEKYYIRGGKGIKPRKITQINHNHYKRIFEKILLLIGYKGICCFDYKVIEDKPVIFELNPRYGGTMTSVIQQGIGAYIDATSVK